MRTPWLGQADGLRQRCQASVAEQWSLAIMRRMMVCLGAAEIVPCR
jgi:hypothetical protein